MPASCDVEPRTFWRPRFQANVVRDTQSLDDKFKQNSLVTASIVPQTLRISHKSNWIFTVTYCYSTIHIHLSSMQKTTHHVEKSRAAPDLRS